MGRSARIVWRPIDEWRGERTRWPKTSPFRASWSDTERKLVDEAEALRRWRNSLSDNRPYLEVVVQLAMDERDFRLDGQPRVNAKAPSHEGVVVQFDPSEVGQEPMPLRFQCDRFNRWRDNVRAIALGMEALRRVDRYGIATGHEQYRGFRAIGAESMPMTGMSRGDAFGLLCEFAGQSRDAWSYAMGDRHEIDRLWKEAASKHHPDVGGDEDTMRKINVARDILLRGT